MGEDDDSDDARNGVCSPVKERIGEPTYGNLGVGLQGKCSKLRLVLVGGGDGHGLLGANTQRELLARRGYTGDGLEACFELGYGPRRGDAALRGGVGRRNEQ